jgi:hypothetical protein
LRVQSREQLPQTGSIVLDESAERHDLRRPFRICCVVHVKEAGLDSLVGGDGDSCDVALPCSEGLDRALPADLRMSLSKETIGDEIVDRDRDHEPALVIVPSTRAELRRSLSAGGHRCYLARIVLFTLQDVVCQERPCP